MILEQQKTSLKCNICDFVAKDGKLLRGHMSLHNPVSGNFENGILSHKDGYTCNKCGETVKTMGLIRRHMKVQHGVGINAAPDTQSQDGARSLPKNQQHQKQNKKFRKARYTDGRGSDHRGGCITSCILHNAKHDA